MRWQIRCLRNTLTAALPFQQGLRRLKRRVSGRAHHIHEQSVYSGGFDQIALLREAGLDLHGCTLLELGSGWYPVIPLMLRLAGASRVVLTDVHTLLDRTTLDAAVAFLTARKADLAERLGMPEDEIEQVLALPQDASLAAVLEMLGLEYRAPFKMAASDVQVDVIYSHTVLEHIPRPILTEVFHYSHHLLVPGGLISHGIDHSDHREHQDPRLSRIDFLRYGDTVWRLLCLNPQDYTNRLRHSDYLAMIRAAGFKTLLERPFVNPRVLASLPEIPLAPRFQNYDREDLATTWSHIVARATAQPNTSSRLPRKAMRAGIVPGWVLGVSSKSPEV